MATKFIRKFTEEERVAIVNETLEYGSNALVAAKYDLSPQMLSTWKGNYRRYQQTLKPKEPKEENIIVNYKKEYKRLVEENKEKDLEIAVLRDLFKKKENEVDYYEYAEQWIGCGAPVTSILRILELNKSTYYRRKQAKKEGNTPVVRKDGVIPGFSYNIDNVKVSDLVIQKYIMEIKGCDYGRHYGYKKVTSVLKRRYCLKINKKKVYRLMSTLGMIQGPRERVTKYKRICKNHLVKQSNQLWEMDTKYIYIACTREVAYLASIIDVFDRSIIACKLSLSANAESAQEVLITALYNRGIKNAVDGLTVRTDNGSQFMAHDFEKLCIKEKIIHERIPVHSPNYNAHIESYHRYLQDECLAGKIFNSLEEAEATIDKYVYGYNTMRVHSSIDYRTPDEFYNLKNCKFKNELVISI